MAPRGTRESAVLLIAWLAVLPTAAAQALLHELTPGGSVSRAGDVDGDSLEDVVAGTRVHSAATGAVIFNLPPVRALGLGDVDGDGFGDLLYWNYQALQLAAFSPATNAVLWTAVTTVAEVYGEDAVADVGDVNGDGRRDFAVAEVGGVMMRSGLDGSVLWGVLATMPSFARVRALGDVDGDGVSDVYVGTAGVTGVRSGATGALIAPGVDGWPIGDVNGDGFDDVVEVFGPMDEFSRRVDLGPALTPAAFVNEVRFINLAAPVGDWNGDGSDEYYYFTDLAYSPCGHDPWIMETGHLVIASGIGVQSLSAFDAAGQGLPGLGGSFARLGDLDGDGRDDFAVGRHPLSPSASPSRIYLSTPAFPSANALPGGCGSPVPALAFSDVPFLGSTFAVRIAGNVFGFLFAGLPAPTPLPGGCTATLDPAAAFLVGAMNPTLAVPLPYDPALAGAVAGLQGLVVDPTQPGGFALTTPVQIVLAGWF